MSELSESVRRIIQRQPLGKVCGESGSAQRMAPEPAPQSVRSVDNFLALQSLPLNGTHLEGTIYAER